MESAMVEKQKTGGAFDWWQRNVTNEIYLNTHRADWWKACLIVGDLIGTQKRSSMSAAGMVIRSGRFFL